jgi:urea transport system permease protein
VSSAPRILRALALLLCLCCGAVPVALADLRGTVNALPEADDAERRALLEAMVTSGDPAMAVVFDALSKGALYLDRRSGEVVLGERRGARYLLTDIYSGEALGQAGRRDVRRVAVDNALREELATLSAVGDLSAPDVATRLAAVEAITAAPSPLAIAALRGRLDKEPGHAVRDAIELGLAVTDLRSARGAALEAALATVRGRSEPPVRAALADLGKRGDIDPELREQARELLARAEARLRWLARLEALFFGLSLGSVLLLSAVGLAITFGVMGVINMAHGELIMLGAYTTWGLQQVLPGQPGLALLLSIPELSWSAAPSAMPSSAA